MNTHLSLPWFYHEDIPAKGRDLVLSGEEARHATGARRLEVNDKLIVFDGRGKLATARIVSPGGRGKSPVLMIEHVDQEKRQGFALHLASALPKGDRQGTMLDMATQIGMSSFTPLQCTRSVAKSSAKSTSRFRRILREACKQSRRAFLPEINPAETPAELADRHDGILLVAHPGGIQVRGVLADKGRADSCTVVIGPEGGFTEDEVRTLRDRGAKLVSLGHGILRTETAAIVMLSHASLAVGVD